jgi:two-component system phosphate regulon response regulator PhoB
MSAEKNILIVEDEAAIREMVDFALRRAGFNTLHAGNGREALDIIANQKPDMVLLDWMLPDLAGIDIARRLKREELTRDVPIIMLTAKAEEHDKLKGFDVGVDDYVTKPFSPRELVARINAVLRRGETQVQDQRINIAGLELDPSSHRVQIQGAPVALGPTEFRLLHFFITHPERVYSRTQLLDHVWGQNVYIEERTVDVHIRRLRKELSTQNYDKMIQTVRGAGYRFSTQV